VTTYKNRFLNGLEKAVFALSLARSVEERWWVSAGKHHPSRLLEPSPEGLDVTVRLAKAGKVLGIDLLDHVVVGNGRYVSMKLTGAF
jgi:DNA repair protein RadC